MHSMVIRLTGENNSVFVLLDNFANLQFYLIPCVHFIYIAQIVTVRPEVLNKTTITRSRTLKCLDFKKHQKKIDLTCPIAK